MAVAGGSGVSSFVRVSHAASTRRREDPIARRIETEA